MRHQCCCRELVAANQRAYLLSGMLLLSVTVTRVAQLSAEWPAMTVGPRAAEQVVFKGIPGSGPVVCH